MIIECDSCNINKVKRRKKVIETSQTDLIWLDHFHIISSKEAGRTGQEMICIVLDIPLFLFFGMIQQGEGRKKKSKS